MGELVGVVSAAQGELVCGIGAALESLHWSPTMLRCSDDMSAIDTPSVLFLGKDRCQVHKLMHVHQPSRCVVVSSAGTLATAIPLVEAGALVVNAAAPFPVLTRLIDCALRQILSGREPQRTSAARLRYLVREVGALERLTPLEALTLQALMDGGSAAQIAGKTHRSLHTVRSQIKSLCSKLGVHSQVSAIAVAERSGSFAAVDLARGTFGAVTDGISLARCGRAAYVCDEAIFPWGAGTTPVGRDKSASGLL